VYSRAKLRRRLALPLITGVTVLLASALTGVLAGPASAATNVYAVAYMGTNGDLWYYDSTTGAHDTGLAMEPGTAPAMTFNGVRYEIAFDASNGFLYYYTPADNSHDDTGAYMYPGASPSIGENDVVAFQGSDGYLWYYEDGSAHYTGLQVMQGTNPAISATGLGATGQEIAFQGGDDNLWLYRINNGSHTDTGLYMYPFSSPSIGDKPNSTCCTVAFNHFASDHLWYYDGTSGHDTGLTMYSRTSPSIDPVGGSELIAFQASTGVLWLYNALKHTHTDTGLPMGFRQNPSLGPSVDSTTGLITGYQVWYQHANNSRLSYYDTSPKSSGSTDSVVNSNSDGVSYTPGVPLS
jgi:hypothetical protein